MDKEYSNHQKELLLSDTKSVLESAETIIPVIQESFSVDKKMIETARIHISKRITEHQEAVNMSLTAEQYEYVHVPIHQTVATPPPAIRQEGDTTIFSIIKELLVVEKRYEIVAELHVIKRTTEHTETQNITLRSEEVSVTREPLPNEV